MNLSTVALAAILVVSPNARAQCPEILVPAYQYPTDGDMWARLAMTPAWANVGAILNPGDGPGAEVDSDYTAAIAGARAGGVRLYGYVYTSYAQRSASVILGEVATYQSLYGPLDGIFLDEMDNELASLSYYSGLTTSIHAMMPGSVVIGNPGTAVPQQYFAQGAADVLVTYENPVGDPGNPYSSAVPPPWAASYPASRFGHIVYNVPTLAAMRQTLALALSRHVGVVFISNDSGNNPYDTLPPYYEQELRPCPADLDNGSGTGHCDGGVDINDLLFFLGRFELGSADVDLDNGSGLGVADGGVDVSDLLFFLARFEAGC